MTDTLKSSKVTRFIAIGGANTALDFGLTYLLASLAFDDTLVIVLATSAAFMFSFFMNKKHTFKTTNTNVKRELLLFVGFTLFGLWVLQSLVIYPLKPLIIGFGFSAPVAFLLAKIPATIVSMTWNYITYDRIVFKHKQGSR